MTPLLPYLYAVLLTVIAISGWALALIGLPGTWLTVAAAGLYCWLGPQTGAMQLTGPGVAGLFGVALLGEVAESLSGVWTTRRVGGSRRASWFALAGSLVGGLAGAGAGIPVPVLGSFVGAILGGALGALGAATFAELTRGETSHQSWRVGRAAFVGRVLGTGAKAIAATLLLVCLLVGLVV